MGQKWRCLSKEERLPYETRAKENKMKYDEEKKLYEQRKAACKEVASVNNEEVNVASTSGNNSDVSDKEQSILSLDDIGFAKQKKYSWHPAYKVGSMARGTRMKVQFFGTGQTSIVDSQNWVSYSVQAESRIKSKELMKSVAFRNGLTEMHSLRQKLMVDSANVTGSGIEFVPEVSARKFRRLDKVRLQREEEENSRILEQKMFYDQSSNMWQCKDCEWHDNVQHRAKCHARDCGKRKVTRQRNYSKKFECSSTNCEASFNLQKDLAIHYR